LLLLLDDLVARLRRLIDQGRGLVILLALGNQSEPRSGHIEKGFFALKIVGLLSKPNALSRVRSIFPSIRHTHSPTRQKTYPEAKQL
jgi:hypothetical protein